MKNGIIEGGFFFAIMLNVFLNCSRINIFLVPPHRLGGVNSPPLQVDQSAHLIDSLIPSQEQPICEFIMIIKQSHFIQKNRSRVIGKEMSCID